MADVDAIHLIRRGPAEWNSARANSNDPVDLSHIEVRNADLRNAQLRHVDFDGAVFMGVDLRSADLRYARVNGVRMSTVRLDGADLRHAELKGADFDRVSMHGARLEDVESFELRIRRSALTNARLSRASLRSAHLYNSDLTGAHFSDLQAEQVMMKRVVAGRTNLQQLKAAGCTIVLPNDPLRADWVDFGHGVEASARARDAYVVHDGQTFWFSVGRWDFFICHSSLDKESFVRPLAEALEKLRQRVWYDELEIAAGDTLDQVIANGIRAANFGVVVVSPTFFGRQWTEREIRSFGEKRVFVVLHQVEMDAVERLAPAVAARYTLSSKIGPAAVARKLVDATSKPPGEM